jgi:hypothetical protein
VKARDRGTSFVGWGSRDKTIVHSGGECRQHTFVSSLKVYGFCYIAIAFLHHRFDLLKSKAAVEKLCVRVAHFSLWFEIATFGKVPSCVWRSSEVRRKPAVSEKKIAPVFRVLE